MKEQKIREKVNNLSEVMLIKVQSGDFNQICLQSLNLNLLVSPVLGRV